MSFQEHAPLYLVIPDTVFQSRWRAVDRASGFLANPSRFIDSAVGTGGEGSFATAAQIRLKVAQRHEIALHLFIFLRPLFLGPVDLAQIQDAIVSVASGVVMREQCGVTSNEQVMIPIAKAQSPHHQFPFH